MNEPEVMRMIGEHRLWLYQQADRKDISHDQALAFLAAACKINDVAENVAELFFKGEPAGRRVKESARGGRQQEARPKDGPSVPERIDHILKRCRTHRDSLAAFHSELCEFYDCDPHSTLGDDLMHVVRDGADYAEAIERDIKRRYRT